MSQFMMDVKDAYHLIAHNIKFDRNVIMNAFKWRLNIDPTIFWPSEAEFCSMTEATDELKLFCKRKFNNQQYKSPTLQELYLDTFSKFFENAHNARGDVDALDKIVWKRWNLLDENGKVI